MEKKARITIDMSAKEHMCLKMSCAKQGISMREFMLRSAFEKIEDLEDELLASMARETLKNIESGKEKTISLEEMKKRIA